MLADDALSKLGSVPSLVAPGREPIALRGDVMASPTTRKVASFSTGSTRVGAGERVSTAREGSSPIFEHLVQQMPPGLILNLGAGATSVLDGRRTLINVDHVLVDRPTSDGRFVVADANHLPFPESVFVGAIAKDVLEHVDDPIQVLRELRRVCGPDGRLLVVVPRAIARAVWDDPTHKRGFSRRAVSTAFALSGWTEAGPVRRLGGFPGAGRLGLTAHLEGLMRVPGLGHWFGRNWIARAVADGAVA